MKNQPLFDPDDDKVYSEADKWRIAYDAVDRHRNRKPGMSTRSSIMLLACSLLTVAAALIIIAQLTTWL